MKHVASCHCSCCAASARVNFPTDDLTRRKFLYQVGALTMGSLTLSSLSGVGVETSGLTKRKPRLRQTLKVQPVLTYEIPTRRMATSWRSWGGIQTEEEATAEQDRITQGLAKLSKQSDFPLELRPVLKVKNAQQAGEIAKGDHDVLLLYAAGGGGNLLETLSVPAKWNLMFLRHNPGPVYLWYEIAHPRFLRKTVDDYGQPGWDVNDVVVDKHEDILWRLRALSGLKNIFHKKIVCVGGAAGWGAGGHTAPARTKELWKMELVDYTYKDLGPRIKAARQQEALVQACTEAARHYLNQRGSVLKTTREFVNNAFLLTEVLKDIMEEVQTDAITINQCMGTIMPMAETTACLPLSLMNDDGYLAFCESDFVVIPSGVLLHYISGLPVFLNDPTYPHDNVVTLAHCTAPRKMDGKRQEPAKIMTHFESDYGAAPKVEMKIGQVCTTLVPDFASKRWVGFEGTIIGNPFLDICRSQIDVRINGDCAGLLQEMKGFHWMVAYGKFLRETGYALKKVGVDFLNVSVPKPV